jgi:hypothetical protein
MVRSIADAVIEATVVTYDANGTVLVCCSPGCGRLLVLAWSHRQIEAAKDKARERGWFVWRDDGPNAQQLAGAVFCPPHVATLSGGLS